MEFIFKRSYRGSIKAVVFDWAGTTVDFGSFAPTAVFLRLFESQGVTITAEDARSGMGLMKRDHLRRIMAQPAVAESWRIVHGAPPSEADVDRLFANFIPMQMAVLTEYAKPIQGVVNLIETLRSKGIKIGSTTGYLRSMMEVLAPEAKRQGYDPDCIICPDDTTAGRPYPWMCYLNAIQLGVYPMQAMVKVGDTIPDIEEGLNAGMWTVGVSLTGNLFGMDETAFQALSPEKIGEARKRIEPQLYQCGAHYVIDGVWDLPEVLDKIEYRLRMGENV